MYTNEVVNASSSKFSKVINDYITRLELNKKQIDGRLVYRNAIEKVKSGENIEDILKVKEILKAVDQNTSGEIDIINFFVENGAPNAEQVSMARENIANSVGINDFLEKTKKDVTSKKNVEDSLKECHNITEGKPYNFDYFLRLLEFSPLTEQERLDVLTKEAFDSCIEGVQKPIKIEEKEEVVTIKQPEAIYEQTQEPVKIEENETVLVAA